MGPVNPLACGMPQGCGALTGLRSFSIFASGGGGGARGGRGERVFRWGGSGGGSCYALFPILSSSPHGAQLQPSTVAREAGNSWLHPRPLLPLKLPSLSNQVLRRHHELPRFIRS